MISPTEVDWYMKLMVGMICLLGFMLVLNFIFVFAGKTEAGNYHRFDTLSSAYMKLFSILLLFTMLWAIVAHLYNIFVR